MKASVILSVLGSGALALAHGYVQDLLISGKMHRGYQPFNDPYEAKKPDRIGWTIPNNSPVEDVTSKAIVCGVDSKAGTIVAPATAGSEIKFFWTEWPESHKGPAMTYLASCPSGDCRKEDPSTLNWFKIHHAGLGANGVWASDALIANNNTLTVTIPSQLKSGAYLLRHELLALHASHEINGSQFYPMCANLQITGSGNGVPASTVKFPGAYKNTDAG
ncbi:glycoside hydrolase [Peziza echinospora]|nr:glycoside hydrolase [Peziza echinospora]